MHKLERTLLTLSRRAATLGNLLRQETNEYQTAKAAERWHEARIRVLRAKIGEFPSPLVTPANQITIQKIEAEIESFLAMNLPMILADFQKSELVSAPSEPSSSESLPVMP